MPKRTTKSRKRRASKTRSRKDPVDGCQVKICIDPKTGRSKIVRGNCPPGFLERWAKSANKNGADISFESGEK